MLLSICAAPVYPNANRYHEKKGEHMKKEFDFSKVNVLSE